MRIAISLAGAALLGAVILAWPAATSQAGLTQTVFTTRGCQDCHTVSGNGTLGFTAKGKRLAQDFEGCSRMLAAMNLVALVDPGQRSPQQRQLATRFGEFGCGFCHKITPGKLGLTEIGSKLGNLHLKCVAVDSCCRRQ